MPAVRGTFRWMSPEQMTYAIMNLGSDIYSFGMTIYEVSKVLAVPAHTYDLARYFLLLRHFPALWRTTYFSSSSTAA
jgi:Protein tyrosine kinase.